jgi:hypothetical protein
MRNYSKVSMYRDAVAEMAASSGGWASIWAWINAARKCESLDAGNDDRLWCTGMYGIYLGHLSREEAADTLPLIDAHVGAIERMLDRTGGVYLRDCLDSYIAQWQAGYLGAEASKDQILGMVTGLYAIWLGCYDAGIRMRITRLLRDLNRHLAKHWGCLYNEKSKRWYHSSGQCFIHYHGISAAMNAVLGWWRERNVLVDALGFIIGKLMQPVLKMKADMIAKTGFMQWWWIKILAAKIPALFDPAEYGLNLLFYEHYCYGMSSAVKARKVLQLLADENVMRLKQFNLGALFLGLTNAYKTMIGCRAWLYYAVLSAYDDVMFPDAILPNECGIDCKFPINAGGGWWQLDTVCQCMQDRSMTLQFPPEWGALPPRTGKTRDDIPAGMHVDAGLTYLMRRYLRNTNKK